MKAAYEDNFVTAYCGDALEVMRGLPAGSVHCCVTSPPYWGLRDYGQDGQLGLEKTPEEYVERLVKYFRAVKRLLRKDGTLWLNLGDSYATRPYADSHTFDPKYGGRNRNQGYPNRQKQTGLKHKDMVGIPWRVAFALQADGWYLRSEIIWHKPNPMPESVTDRPTKSHETIFLLSRSPRYYYDAEAIKEPGKNPEDDLRRIGAQHDDNKSVPTEQRAGLRPRKVPAGWDTRSGRHDEEKVGRYRKTDKQRDHGRRHAGFNDRWDGMSRAEQCSKGRNKRSVWTVATQSYDVEACLACRRVYDGAEYRRLRREKVDETIRVYCVCGAYDHWKSHYATFPPNLILPCILAGSSERGCCPKCGAPWRRLVKSEKHFESGSGRSGNPIAGKNGPECQGGGDTGDIRKGPVLETKTVGWQAGCKCGAEPEPCVVLDPFAGSGTTGQVARETGRRAILIELNFDDIDLLTRKRFGASPSPAATVPQTTELGLRL